MTSSRDSSNARTRLTAVCQSCRGSHLKCDTRLPSCSRCEKGEIECVRTVNVRFRYHCKSASNTDLSFSENQTWLTLPKELRFLDETSNLILAQGQGLSPSIDDDDDYVNRLETLGDLQQQEHRATTFSGDHIMAAQILYPVSDQHQCDPTTSLEPSQDVHGDETMTSGHQNDAMESMEQDYEVRPYRHNGDLEHSNVAFYSLSKEQMQATTNSTSNHGITIGSPESITSLNDLASLCAQELMFSAREAFLMRNFIENMALWADVADLERYFEAVVPRRALQQPMLRYAIYAFSSHHASRFVESDSTEAIQYHAKCLELLIPVLSESSEKINEDILATIAILRQYEEMDAFDQRCHLLGTTRILNSVASFGCSGGLGESAAWLCLRQDIYVSLVSQQPLKTHLENYFNSMTFQRNDDVSLANRMVFLLAKVLTCAFHPEPNTDVIALQKVSEEVDDWANNKPASFEPILFNPRSLKDGRAFPEIWMLLPFHVVGLQYYHIAKIVLTIWNSRKAISSYENLRAARKLESVVRSHLHVILGLAASNRRAENTLFTARHALSVWGGVLRDKMDQDAAISFLLKVEDITGWKMKELIQSLEGQWAENRDMS